MCYKELLIYREKNLRLYKPNEISSFFLQNLTCLWLPTCMRTVNSQPCLPREGLVEPSHTENTQELRKHYGPRTHPRCAATRDTETCIAHRRNPESHATMQKTSKICVFPTLCSLPGLTAKRIRVHSEMIQDTRGASQKLPWSFLITFEKSLNFMKFSIFRGHAKIFAYIGNRPRE